MIHSYTNSGPFGMADLPMTPDGKVYHLDIDSGQLARDIIIVGDPQRVPSIAGEHLSKIECQIEHRGLCTITGEAAATGQRISVVTSGMGTPSLEIVFNELMALNEIDPETRMRRNQIAPLHIIRLGTSGGLQKDIKLGASIISTYGVGLDNTGLFYEVAPQDDACLALEAKVKSMLDTVMDKDSRFYGKIFPYAARADQEVVAALTQAAQDLGVGYETGVTVSAGGFFANQGRDVGRAPLSVPDIDRHLAELPLDIGGQRILNFEMETSHLLHFAAGHAYRAGSVCVAIANRREDTFDSNYQESVHNATRVALQALGNLRALSTL